MNLNSFLLFSDRPENLTEFYGKVFQKKPDWSVGEFEGYLVGDGYLTIGPHKEVHGNNQNPERFMFNLETENVKGEFERIKKLGVQVVSEPYHPSESSDMIIATFSDPDNNYFQLISPMK